jgi:hypothetical protein
MKESDEMRTETFLSHRDSIVYKTLCICTLGGWAALWALFFRATCSETLQAQILTHLRHIGTGYSMKYQGEIRTQSYKWKYEQGIASVLLRRTGEVRSALTALELKGAVVHPLGLDDGPSWMLA